MPRPLIFLLGLVLCGVSNSSAQEQSLWSGLTVSQQEKLLSGKALELEEDVPDSAWPRFTIYHLVQGKPDDVAAVFWNCELAPAYIPNCTSVRILGHPSASVHEAEYTLKMPFFLPDEVYVSRNTLHKIGPSEYEISWKVLSSRYTKSCSGKILIQGHDDKTLLRYSNLVVPGGRFAGLLRSTAGNQVIDSVHALVHQVEFELSSDRGLLDHQLHELEKVREPAP